MSAVAVDVQCRSRRANALFGGCDGYMLMRFIEPFLIEIRCRRCKTTTLVRINPETGFPVHPEGVSPTAERKVLASA